MGGSVFLKVLMTTKDKNLLAGIKHHQLNATWTFHYLIPSREGNKNTNWENFLKPLHNFKTLEDFYGIMNAVERPEKLPQGCRYYIFKEGIKPLWETKENDGGHQIILDFPVQKKGGHDKSPERVSQKWQDLALHMLCQDSKNKDFTEGINGIEFNNRGKALKIAIWYHHDRKNVDTAFDFVCKQMTDFPSEKFSKKIDTIPSMEETKKRNDEKREDKKAESK